MGLTQENEQKEDEAKSLKSKLCPKKDANCIICGAKAEFCMRGIPKNTYCRECAEAYFQMIDYLDSLN
jgi:hypothetical protein